MSDNVPQEEDVIDALTDRQVDAARMLAMNPGRAKVSVAVSLGISRRSLFRWLNNQAFLAKIKEFRRSPVITGDVEAIYEMLGEKEKEELRELLGSEKSEINLSELMVIEERILEAAAKCEGPRDQSEALVEAVCKIALMLGRILRKGMCLVRYEPDGRPCWKNRREWIEEFFEEQIVRAGVGGDEELGYAIDAACKAFSEHPGGANDASGLDWMEATDRVITDALDDWKPERGFGSENSFDNNEPNDDESRSLEEARTEELDALIPVDLCTLHRFDCARC